MKEKFHTGKLNFPFLMFPNFSSALDNVFNNLASINLYQNSTLNQMFHYVKKLKTELSERNEKLEGIEQDNEKKNSNKHKAEYVSVTTKAVAKKHYKIQYYS